MTDNQIHLALSLLEELDSLAPLETSLHSFISAATRLGYSRSLVKSLISHLVSKQLPSRPPTRKRISFVGIKKDIENFSIFSNASPTPQLPKSPSFARERKNSLTLYKDISPGPGTYTPKTRNKPPSHIISRTQFSRLNSNIEPTTGPGSYTQYFN